LDIGGSDIGGSGTLCLKRFFKLSILLDNFECHFNDVLMTKEENQ
jgi:hypothetical protein